MPSPNPYKLLETRLIDWLNDRQDIVAALTVGSRAEPAPPADHYSDLDILLFTTKPEAYLGAGDWIGLLGDTWIQVLRQTGGGRS
jgi:hypothetical protein